jgi:hypothetical protein
MKIEIEISDNVAKLLAVLAPRVVGSPEERVKYVLMELADHAQQGVYRPGSWERPWVHQAFGSEFESALEEDPTRGANGYFPFDRVRT